jgi:hypothetical protein
MRRTGAWIKELEILEELDRQPPYTIDADGKTILTSYFLRKRGVCCGSGCRNCPYTPKHIKGNTNI